MTNHATTPIDLGDLTPAEAERVRQAGIEAMRRAADEQRRRRADMARWAQRWGAPPAAVSAETALEAE